jgi:putative FmdB family regulatory protein
MPIYEFYCRECNTLFNFFSRTINTNKTPFCPKCKKEKLKRQISIFAVCGRAKEGSDLDDFPFDESKMEQAMNVLAGEAENMNEEDPKQAANMMRKLSEMSGLKLGYGMEEALSRMEKGEDPEKIEAEMGDILENEDPFLMPGRKGKISGRTSATPIKDDTLYDL